MTVYTQETIFQAIKNALSAPNPIKNHASWRMNVPATFELLE